ncbi:MAG: sulfate adenylyltransferase [Dehalococcoidia bacterium]|nr:sulfate adenylyltransferase [Dehalococcoidia bacterium]
MSTTTAVAQGRGVTVWLTGLSGAGKTTITTEMERQLTALGRQVEVLDGDVVRTNLSKGLGFSKEDRDTNIRRIGFVSKLLTRNGAITIVAAISPYREVRDEVRRDVGDFVEVFVHCPLDDLVKRDVKGLYAKAIAGEIKNFTGVSDPYEEPLHPEVVVHTHRESVAESVGKVMAKLRSMGYLPSDGGNSNGANPGPSGLVDRYAPAPQWSKLRADSAALPKISLNPRQLSDAHMLAQGVFSPLSGFLTRQDYTQVVEHMHLAGGQPWPIPVTLAVADSVGASLKEGQRVSLADEKGQVVGVLELQEKYRRDKKLEARLVYRTEDAAHPGVANLYAEGDLLLGGPVTMFAAPQPEADIAPFYRTPAQTRQEFARLGWKTVVGFQTRNPVHRAHEYIQKCAMEVVDGLLLHPLVGETKSDDIPALVRMRCYQALLENYYPKERVLLSVYPAFMRYAGPREAVFHALARRNYGCTHFIVGRDHAGVGNYYGTYDAQHIFKEFDAKALGITPLFFENSFYCPKCGAVASTKTCPHDAAQRISVSGTAARAMLQKGELLPPEFTRPEVSRILSAAG